MNTLTRMVVVVLGCALGVACEPLHTSFVRTDGRFTPSQRSAPPAVLLQDSEVNGAPPFHVVGLVEVQGSDQRQLGEFIARVQSAGALAGCDVLVQRGVYDHRPEAFVGFIPSDGNGAFSGGRGATGAVTRRADGNATWQFFCGVEGETQDATSYEQALSLALQHQSQEHGEPCRRAAPRGGYVQLSCN